MKSREEYHKHVEELASYAFKDHVLKSESQGNWLIRHPRSSAFWTRIIAAPPYLICVGDCDTAVFWGHPSDGEIGMVRWVVRSGLDYIAGKCSLGMDVQPNAGFRIEKDVFLHDVEEFRKEEWEFCNQEDLDHIRYLAEEGDIEGAKR